MTFTPTSSDNDSESATADTAPSAVVEVAPALIDLFAMPSRYKVADGGRGSAKSWGFARMALAMSLARKNVRILCARELQVSIRDSVHKLLSDQISALRWDAFFSVKQHDITNVLGGEFIFEGLRHNVNKIKSMEGIDICWVEEAEKVSRESWNVLIPTIRQPGSEIWVSYNRDLSTDPTDTMFWGAEPPPDTRRCHLTHADNPWFPDELRREMEYMYRVDPEGAEHVWGGQYRKNSTAAVMRGKWRIEAFETPTNAEGPYLGADFGFSVDPSTLVKCWIKDRCLYIEHEAYGVGVELDDMPAFYDRVPGARTLRIRADCARPETISHLARRQFDITGAAKWTGSVEDGIAFLRSFEAIVIHERCKHSIEEARLYSYKVDRLTGDVLTDIVDANNHIWDAVRYALEPMIRRGNCAYLDFLKIEAGKKTEAAKK